MKDVISEARKAYPRATCDLEAVCLMVSYLDGLRGDRLEVLNLNCAQARRIAQLELEVADLKR